MMFPRPVVLALCVVLAVLPAACGGDDVDDPSADTQFPEYCAKATSDQEIFADDGTGLGLVTNLDKLTALAALAPDDLSDEWQTFLGALKALDAAITSVGLKPSDFVDAQPPAGISAADKATIAAAADRLGQPDVAEAATGIEQQAKDICKLQLGL